MHLHHVIILLALLADDFKIVRVNFEYVIIFDN